MHMCRDITIVRVVRKSQTMQIPISQPLSGKMIHSTVTASQTLIFSLTPFFATRHATRIHPVQMIATPAYSCSGR